MDEGGPLFILAGNGSYENRGCEAIVRGTVKILHEHFKDPRFFCLSHFNSEQQYQEQCLRENDKSIDHLAFRRLQKEDIIRKFWKLDTLGGFYQYLFHRDSLSSWGYAAMLPYVDKAAAVLSVGGDNYSLDYGLPMLFTSLDDIVIEKKKPLILWGASVGPFDKIPDYEQYMSRHLRMITGIFARESATIDYLRCIGVSDNVYPVADPAFLMDAVKPPGIEDDLTLEDETIGINLSPLMAKYVSGGDLEQWTKIAASIISDIAKKTEMPIYLIPHVTNPDSDDHAFMQRALSLIKGKKEKITLISPHYNAAETKWIISQMKLFAGARTHATIAALSSGVPTLSFAYSLKAKGINRDIFGHTRYCIDPENLGTETISDRVLSILEENSGIRRTLEERIPDVQNLSMNAGSELKKLIDGKIND